jgi:hypothetical protein
MKAEVQKIGFGPGGDTEGGEQIQVCPFFFDLTMIAVTTEIISSVSCSSGASRSLATMPDSARRRSQ